MGISRKNLGKFKLNPPRVLALGFAALILLGTLLLNLSISTKTGQSIGILDALFTATSSVCVTGFMVVNTAEYWSLFGQIVIIILVQIGSLGFMTLATTVALLMGKKITLKERLIIKQELNQETTSGLVRLAKYVVLSTFVIEGLGAILLSTRFIPQYGLVKGIGYSVFHSVSAFCNAGIDILGNNMVPYAGDFVIIMTIALLTIIGGLGFSVYIDISKNRTFKKLHLHSKLVISISIILIISGMFIFYIIEKDNPDTLLYLSGKEKLLTSFFQSVITRSAGFNSVDISLVYDTTAFIMIIFMFIGGSPGSTAGGIKTTTFGTILLTTITVIKGNRDVVIFKKRLNQSIINRSLAIVGIGLTLVLAVSILLTITEDSNFLDILFETTSAFGIVGLTRGITPNLSNIGKVIIALTMYTGRVGPLTMAFAFARNKNQYPYRYSEGNIMVG